MGRERRRGTAVPLISVVLLLAVAVAAWVYAPEFLNRYGDRLFSMSQCTASLDGEEYTLTAEQANNAALIIAASAQRDLPARAATIGIATAIQESSLRNIDYGDRDSLGLFQQRPSQGWGTEEEIMDPYYSTEQFYSHLVRVDGWQEREITDAAQAVQRSAFPEAYGQHEEGARLWASAVRGFSGADALTCELRSVEPGDPTDFVERVDADFGDGFYTTEVIGRDGDLTSIAVTPASGSQQDRHMMLAWAQAVASTQSVNAVRLDDSGTVIVDVLTAN